jgi:hypothetical protein
MHLLNIRWLSINTYDLIRKFNFDQDFIYNDWYLETHVQLWCQGNSKIQGYRKNCLQTKI